MRTSLRSWLLCFGLLATAPALATVPVAVPEPGVMELLAAGVVAGLIVWVRNRRK